MPGPLFDQPITLEIPCPQCDGMRQRDFDRCPHTATGIVTVNVSLSRLLSAMLPRLTFAYMEANEGYPYTLKDIIASAPLTDEDDPDSLWAFDVSLDESDRERWQAHPNDDQKTWYVNHYTTTDDGTASRETLAYEISRADARALIDSYVTAARILARDGLTNAKI